MREELLQQQKEYIGTVAWRPSGSVSNDIRAHDMAILKAKSEQLSVMLDQEERKANEMFAKVSKARQRMQQYQIELAIKRETVNKLIENVEHQEEADVKLLKTLTGPTMM
ncbi:hypothetical protein ONE63_010628 [Megalurothrips usitatus]|uniref:Uncharacterized protein n=1 Tax=Megalurothrips usitatus TaxID=439358 RepID=A0AAV7XHK5_9NEOP|nr:hypothetical protein ONE63_010628 [Megalurothrips usitatus]